MDKCLYTGLKLVGEAYLLYFVEIETFCKVIFIFCMFHTFQIIQ